MQIRNVPTAPYQWNPPQRYCLKTIDYCKPHPAQMMTSIFLGESGKKYVIVAMPCDADVMNSQLQSDIEDCLGGSPETWANTTEDPNNSGVFTPNLGLCNASNPALCMELKGYDMCRFCLYMFEIDSNNNILYNEYVKTDCYESVNTMFLKQNCGHFWLQYSNNEFSNCTPYVPNLYQDIFVKGRVMRPQLDTQKEVYMTSDHREKVLKSSTYEVFEVFVDAMNYRDLRLLSMAFSSDNLKIFSLEYFEYLGYEWQIPNSACTPFVDVSLVEPMKINWTDNCLDYSTATLKIKSLEPMCTVNYPC
jgi:hypothetical protein